MLTNKKSNQAAFFVVALLLVIFFSFYYFSKNKTDSALVAPVTDSTPAEVATTENFFQKPDSPTPSSTPVVVPQTKTVAELEQTAQSQESTAADYNLLAMAYYKKGDQANAAKTITDGLTKYPDNQSLIQTKDLIENILPNL